MPTGLNRRQLLKSAAAGAAAATLGGPVTRWASAFSSRPSNRPPNVLLIMTDEHDPGVTGSYGNKLVQTPNIDRLAATGVTFDNCYCNSPLCVPSRSAFTSCKYVSRTGAWNNNCWLPSDDMPSIARVMNAAGYQSYLCGKMHYDATRTHGFTKIIKEGNNGFMAGHGKRRDAEDTSIAVKAMEHRFEEFKIGDHSGTINHDLAVTGGAVDFLHKRGKSEKPFFMVVGYLAPHFPLTVPKKFYEPYNGKVAMPNIPPGHLDTLPLNYQHLRRGFGVVNTDPKMVKFGRELYYGLTNWVDDQIGQVLASLKKSGMEEDTVIIYTSDHGEQAGEHGLWWKNSMYQRSAGIPLIFNFPQRWGTPSRRTGACAMVDTVRTVAELGGAKVPDDWNGTSMCNWLDDSKSAWKDLAVSEYYAHNIASGYVMIRQGQYKYVYHTLPDKKHPAQRELYDLSADPGEFTNLATKPQHALRMQSLHDTMIKEVGRHPDETEQKCRADCAKGYGRPGGKHKGGGEET